MRTINWNETELVNWLGTPFRPLKADKTLHTYQQAFKAYSEFTGLSAKRLIDEAEKEFEGRQRSRGTVKRRLKAFLLWLESKKGLKPKTANTYFSAIRGFYHDNNFPVSYRKREIKKARAVTERKMIQVKDVKKLLASAYKTRDKAMIIMMFQSGMDVSTLLSLDYAHVARARKFGNGLMLTVVRPKTTYRYRTFLGKDAVTYLESYIREREMQYGRKLRLGDPLFVTARAKPPKKGQKHGTRVWTNHRISTHTVEGFFKRLVVRAGLVTQEELDYYPINPAGAHALRSSFSKIGTAVGINKNAIDYFQGHETEYNDAYTRLPDEELWSVYRRLEPHLAVSQTLGGAMDRLREQASLFGLNLDKLIEQKAREMAESGMGSGGGEFPDVENVEFAREVLKAEIQRSIGISNGRASPVQKVILEDELAYYLNNGWRYVSSLNNGSNKCVVERP